MIKFFKETYFNEALLRTGW